MLFGVVFACDLGGHRGFMKQILAWFWLPMDPRKIADSLHWAYMGFLHWSLMESQWGCWNGLWRRWLIDWFHRINIINILRREYANQNRNKNNKHIFPCLNIIVISMLVLLDHPSSSPPSFSLHHEDLYSLPKSCLLCLSWSGRGAEVQGRLRLIPSRF